MKKSLRSLRLCGENLGKKYFTARFARVAEDAETGKRQALFNYQKYFSDKIQNAFILPLRSLRLCGENSGFSLIEVLVAMAIMTVIIVMVTNMFRDASEAWDTGTQRAEMNTAARAAIEYIARELSCATAGSVPTSTGGVATTKSFVLIKGTNISFAALSGEDQALRGIRFRYADRTIEADFATNNFQPYASGGYTWDSSALLITNVWSFEVTVCSNESQMTSGGVGDSYDSSVPANANLLPACVDISIEMLGERDMARALSLDNHGNDSDPTSPRYGYVMTNSRVYTTRVCFPNRGGGR